MHELTNADGNEVAGYLARVVPRTHDEADRLAVLIRWLSRSPLPHDRDLLDLTGP
jgi:hypothetical protein